MGIFESGNLGSDAGEHFHHPPDKCFYCFEPLHGDVWIYWQGHDSQIWMHPACAKKLADHLNKDWDRFKREHPEKK